MAADIVDKIMHNSAMRPVFSALKLIEFWIPLSIVFKFATFLILILNIFII